jgi:hypothetical protein
MSFKVPISLGTLPQSSGSITNDQVFNGQDGTQLTIKGGVGSTYSKQNTVDYRSNKNDWIFQFLFPVGTVQNGNKEFKTSKSIYTFSDVDVVITTEEGGVTRIKKNMNGGTVKIRDNLEPEIPGKAFVESLSKPTTTTESIKKHPLYSIGYILYLWLMDMIVVLIFWLLIASISCWLIVPAKYLYPSDLTKFPYVYYKEGETAFGYLRQQDQNLCLIYPESDRKNLLKKQAEWFAELDGLKEGREILEALYPDLVHHRADGANTFSSLLLDKCSQKDPCTTDYMIYFVVSLLFYNHIYCNSILSAIHSGAKNIKDSLSGIPTFVWIPFLAIVLYILFSGVGEVNEQFKHLLGIKKGNPAKQDLNTVIKEQFGFFILSILSCCFCLILPVCSILVVTCIATTAYVLFKTALSPYNGLVALVAILTILSSIGQYVFILRNIMRGKNPFDLLESMFVTNMNPGVILSFLGVTIPILYGLIYGGYIGVNLFLSLLKFIKRDDVKNLLRSTLLSYVLVMLYLLHFHIKSQLGGLLASVTAAVILFMGGFIYMRKSSPKDMVENPLLNNLVPNK